MADRDNSIAAKVRRSRPTIPVPIGGEVFTLRVPTMGAIREFQAAGSDPDRAATRVANLLHECVLTDEGGAITKEAAAELADSPWLNGALIEAIIELSMTGGVKVSPGPEPAAAGAGGDAAVDTGAGTADTGAAAGGAEGQPEKEPRAG